MNQKVTIAPHSAESAGPGAVAAGLDFDYLVGVDGGGTGTRVVLANTEGVVLSRGNGGPSGLVHGRQNAWQAILLALTDACRQIGIETPALSRIAIGCGLAGINNIHWRAEFIACNPGFALLVPETDAYTTLLGAHQGRPGAIIALGTGSVGEVLQADGQRREVGGWGFPVSDEASGAWLGMRAVNHLQRALDGRAAMNPFAAALLARCGSDKDGLFGWLAAANQTRYAELAPLVIEFAGSVEVAGQIMYQAGLEVQQMAQALNPDGSLPVALCGGLGQALLPYLPAELAAQVSKPLGDSASGALILVSQQIKKTDHTRETSCSHN